MNFFDDPAESYPYLKKSMIRLSIMFFLLYGFLHVTQMWPGFESPILIIAALSVVYHFAVYFKKRKRESAQDHGWF